MSYDPNLLRSVVFYSRSAKSYSMTILNYYQENYPPIPNIAENFGWTQFSETV